MKRFFKKLHIATLAAISVSAAVLPAHADDAKLAPKLRIGYVGFEKTKFVADVQGFLDQKGEFRPTLEKAGVSEISIVALTNGTNVNEALASDQIDVGFLGDTPAVIGRANGLKTRLLSVSPNNNVWLVTKPGGPKTLEELRGKTVSTAQGSYMSKYLIGLLKETGLSGDVKFVSLIPPDAKAALTRGDIAAYAYPLGFAQDILAEGFVSIDDASKRPNLLGTSVVVVSEKYLANNPGFPKIWAGLHAKAVSAAKSEPDAFYTFLSKATGYKLESVKIAYPFDHWDEQSFTDEALKQVSSTKSFLFDQGIVQENFDLAEWKVE